MKSLSAKIFVPFGCIALFLVLFVTGCATTSEPTFTSDQAIAPTPQAAGDTNLGGRTSQEGVRFQVGDMIKVSFSENIETIPTHEERIKEDGTITLPYIGAVVATNKLAGELQKEIHEAYVPKYYVRLTVTVTPGNELSYTVLGEVRAPGPKGYLGVTTVTKAIGAAAGLTDFASRRKITLTRANGTKVHVNYNDAIADPRKDPQVFPGDIINVEKKWW